MPIPIVNRNGLASVASVAYLAGVFVDYVTDATTPEEFTAIQIAFAAKLARGEKIDMEPVATISIRDGFRVAFGYPPSPNSRLDCDLVERAWHMAIKGYLTPQPSNGKD